MDAPKGNGLTTPRSQTAKTLTKHTTDFIASCARFTSATGTFSLTIAALVLSVVLVRLGALQ